MYEQNFYKFIIFCTIFCTILLLFTLVNEVVAHSEYEVPAFPSRTTVVGDWFDQPKLNEPEPKENWFKVILWRSDKWRTSETWRYYPHITHRYYYDCSYYKYVNCKDFRFCKCWQCRDYKYNYEYGN